MLELTEAAAAAAFNLVTLLDENFEKLDDDLEETVKKRLEIYHRQNGPLVSFYRSWAEAGGAGAPRFHRVDGAAPVESVRDSIFASLA